MDRDTQPTVLLSVLFALMLAFDVFHSLLDLNRLSFWSQDAFVIGIAALLLVGAPAALGFLALSRLLRRLVKNAMGAALLVALAGLAAYSASVAAFDPDESAIFVRSHLGFVCFLAAGALMAWRPPRVRGSFLGAFALGIVVTLAAGRGVVTYASVVDEVESMRVSPPPHGGRVLLVGVDGLGWDTMQRWAAAHPSQDWAWFRERALMAPLDTLVPTLSPRIWSSIATGVPPEDHGVTRFTSWQYSGLNHSRLESPRFEGAFYWNRVLERLGLARRLPVSSLDLRKPPLWEIVGRPAYPVDVLAWWATWPAQPLPGRMVSDKFYFSRGDTGMHADEEDPGTDLTSLPPVAGAESAAGLTFPPHLAAELAPLRRAPETMTIDEVLRFVNPSSDPDRQALNDLSHPRNEPLTEIRYAYTSDETWLAIAMKFLDDAPLNSTMFAYFRGLDMVSHGCMRFSHLYPETEQANRETNSLYSETVCRYYDYVFPRLRSLIEKAGENAVVLIVSDHGFEHLGDGEFGHYNAPQGVLMALGAGRTGAQSPEAYHLYDVAPTLLWLRGYPASNDMPGRAREELFPGLGAAGRQALATYGYRVITSDSTLANAQSDEEMMRLLKTLGYVK